MKADYVSMQTEEKGGELAGLKAASCCKETGIRLSENMFYKKQDGVLEDTVLFEL